MEPQAPTPPPVASFLGHMGGEKVLSLMWPGNKATPPGTCTPHSLYIILC